MITTGPSLTVATLVRLVFQLHFKMSLSFSSHLLKMKSSKKEQMREKINQDKEENDYNNDRVLF